MSSRPTSAQALREAEANGKLNGKRYEVALAFTTYGPGTSAEVLQAAGLDRNRNLARARVTELANAGMLKEIETRRCTVTKRQAIVWSFEKCEKRTPVSAKMLAEEKRELAHALLDAAALTLGRTEGVAPSELLPEECEDIRQALKWKRLAEDMGAA